MIQTKVTAACLTLLILCFAVLSPTVRAQNECPSLQIRNESSAQIDERTLCAAAKPWIDNGEQVYIFATDARPASEDAWFALRDEIESEWRIFNPADDTFAKTALAVEVTTDTSKPWGHDIAFGEALFGTPLDNDATIQRLEGRLKNQVAAGNLTAAIGDALSGSFVTAFPQAQSNGAPPNVAGQPPATTEPRAGLSPSRPLFLPLTALVAILVAAFFFVPRVLVPMARRRRKIQEKRRHLADLRHKVGGLLYAARTLFTGDEARETTLWKLFLIYGGDKYAELATEVQGWVQHSMRALHEALLLSQELQQREPGKREEDVTEMIRAYEMLYLTLVGTDPQLLKMDEEAFRTFIDPMAGGIERPVADDAVVTQIRDLRTQLVEQPLRIDLIVVEPQEVQADGIFGYANRIKEVLARLAKAQAAAPSSLAVAHSARERAATELVLPAELDSSTAFAAVDARLKQADDEAAAERWLAVEEQVAAITVLLDQLAAFIPEVVQTLGRHREREQRVRAIAANGFHLRFLPEAEQSCNELIETLFMQIRNGDLEAARWSLQSFETRSTTMQQQAQALVDLHEGNAAGLQQLATEVARVEALRLGETAQAWTVLQTYPASNWQNIVDNYGAATLTLAQLFDEPTNPHDLASSIERKNGMDQQAFDEAAHDLREAWAALTGAEGKLQELIGRLQKVREIEQNGALSLAAAQTDLNRAIARRDQDADKIDVEVDRQIETARDALREAHERMAGREYTTAGDLIERVRALATAAYNAADAQARAIDEGYHQLRTIQGQATRTVDTANAELTQLPAAALGANTAPLCLAADEQLQRAGLEATKLQGLQDRALAAAIEAVLARYADVEQAAQQALAQVRLDRSTYEGLIGNAQAALQAAQGAIGAAQRYTTDIDAGGAGNAVLQQAHSLLPAFPAFGAPTDLFQRVAADARRSQELAEMATSQARIRINEVRAAREAERRRREEAERRRREAEAAERRQRDSLNRAASAAMRSSSSRSSSSRSSSFGGSSSSRSSSMGSSRRR